MRAADRVRPDLADVADESVDGIEATRRSIAMGVTPAPRIIVLTAFDLDRHVYDALRAGASGFLTKDVGRGASLGWLDPGPGRESQPTPRRARRNWIP